MERTGATFFTVETKRFVEALKELKRRGLCDHPGCLKPAARAAWDDDGFKIAYCEEHVKTVAPLFAKMDGKPLMWVKIRELEDVQSTESKILTVFEDIKFNEKIRGRT